MPTTVARHPTRHEANVNALFAGAFGIVMIIGGWLTFAFFAPWTGASPSVAVYTVLFLAIIPLLAWFVQSASREDEVEE